MRIPHAPSVVAQLVEWVPVKHLVVGASPTHGVSEGREVIEAGEAPTFAVWVQILPPLKSPNARWEYI